MGSPNLRACILPNSIKIALNKADCIQCRPCKNIAISEYICHLLNLPYTLQMASNMIHGQTRSRISMGNLSVLEIPIPPLELQQRFAEIVNQLSKTEQYQQQSSQELDNLFNTLMQKAFNGELVS
jgi:type I restriction enzyme S subunit